MTEISKTYIALYPDGHNEKIVLGELLHKGGAAGKIYCDASHEKSVAKIFHDREHSDINRKKLQAMLHNRPDIPAIKKDNIEYIQIAWPTALLEDEQGFCVGYLMPLIDTEQAISLDYLIQKAVRKKLNLPENYAYRLLAAFNITSVVAALHACGHYIVDLKPSNVSVYKKNMYVALFDCDGFSIQGENNERYPAEFVSEEYIYPEGMQQNCKDMGEEQDKFALAVIIFKLLNEGIHPFSGTPRKKEDMLSIQERIAQYHYAYGFWPDQYQAPHPYSIHDYLDKETMNLFERAFGKATQRPSALEWQEHLEYLWNHRRQCKKNKNHLYFTPKGCGLCIVAEKLKIQLDNYKKQQEEAQTVRGLDIDKLSQEIPIENKTEKAHIKHLQDSFFYLFSGAYFLFFTFLYKMVSPLRNFLLEYGIFAQLFLIVLLVSSINFVLAKIASHQTTSKQHNILSMLQIYAYICIIIAYITINGLPFDLFKLAE